MRLLFAVVLWPTPADEPAPAEPSLAPLPSLVCRVRERLEDLEEDVGYFVQQAGTLLQWHWTHNPRHLRAYQIQQLERALQLVSRDLRTVGDRLQRRLLEIEKLQREFQDLLDQLAYIAYYNRTRAKPYKWTYTGRPLNV
jgi:hypothetical protein